MRAKFLRKVLGFLFFLPAGMGQVAVAQDAETIPAMNTLVPAFESSAPKRAAELRPYKRYFVESGIVEYIISGTQSGIEIAYFDRWGRREARYTKSEVAGLGFSNTLTIIDGEWIYTIHLDKKIGSKIKNELLMKALEESSPEDKTPLGEKMMSLVGGEKIDNERIGEKMCDIWEIKHQGQKFWIWNGIPLKSEQKTAFVDTTFAAVSLQAGALISEEKFKIPEDINFIEGNINDMLLSLLTFVEPKELR